MVFSKYYIKFKKWGRMGSGCWEQNKQKSRGKTKKEENCNTREEYEVFKATGCWKVSVQACTPACAHACVCMKCVWGVLEPQWGFLPEFIPLERGKEREEESERREEGECVSYTNYLDFGPARFACSWAALRHTSSIQHARGGRMTESIWINAEDFNCGCTCNELVAKEKP